MESYFAARQGASPVSAEKTASFHPLFSVLGAPMPSEEPSAKGNLAAPATSQVELVQTEGRVTKIVVTCRCCERIELVCEY